MFYEVLSKVFSFHMELRSLITGSEWTSQQQCWGRIQYQMIAIPKHRQRLLVDRITDDPATEEEQTVHTTRFALDEAPTLTPSFVHAWSIPRNLKTSYLINTKALKPPSSQTEFSLHHSLSSHPPLIHLSFLSPIATPSHTSWLHTECVIQSVIVHLNWISFLPTPFWHLLHHFCDY